MRDRAGVAVSGRGPNGSAGGVATVVLVVGSRTSPRRSSEIMRWVRTLLPAALILVASKPLDVGGAEDVVTLNADDVDAGPLAVAAAIAGPRPGRE